MVASLTFLTPLAGVVALAVVLPACALAVAAARVEAARRALGLAAPARPLRAGVAAALAVPALLGLAAAQPAVRTERALRVRTDAAAFYVFDTSRSMLAAPAPGRADRLERARRAALELRAALPFLPSGVATLTDRVLPAALPTADQAVFDSTVRDVVGVDRPPPREENVRATTFSALGALGTQNFFPRSARRRVVVLLTDGESRPIDRAAVGRDLARGAPALLVPIRFWSSRERIWGTGGRPDPVYRPDPASATMVSLLAAAAGGRAYSEGELSRARAAVTAFLGRGPVRAEGFERRTSPLGPYVALAALLPLGAALVRPRR